jgi:hypothetical protein
MFKRLLFGLQQWCGTSRLSSQRTTYLAILYIDTTTGVYKRTRATMSS